MIVSYNREEVKKAALAFIIGAKQVDKDRAAVAIRNFLFPKKVIDEILLELFQEGKIDSILNCYRSKDHSQKIQDERI